MIQVLTMGSVLMLQNSAVFAPHVQFQLVTTLLQGAYDTADPELAMSLAAMRSQMAHELHGPGVKHAAALGNLVHAQLFRCEKPSAIKQTIKLARQTLERCSRHFTLLHLNLERAVIAYYLFLGRISDVETKMCKLYLQIQQVYDPHHEITAVLMNDIALCLNIQGNFSDALDMLREALALFERPGATHATQHACALAHNNLAVSLAALGHPREAQKHLRVALKGIRVMRSHAALEHPTLFLQGVLLLHLGELEAAKDNLLKVLQHYSHPRHRRVAAAAAALETLALVFIGRGDAASAESCLDQSLAVAHIISKERSMRQLNDVEVAKCHYLLSLICLHLGKHDKAVQSNEKFQKINMEHRTHPFLSWTANTSQLQEIVQQCMSSNSTSPKGPVDHSMADVTSISSSSGNLPGGQRVLQSDPDLEGMEMK